MDAAIKQQRNSRWDREPVLDAAGRSKVARLTERDIEIFKLLGRYTYLPLDDIHAFVSGSLKGLSQHINILSRKPNLYLRRPLQQRQSADANYRRLIYQLDDNGIAVLRERKLPIYTKRYHGNFAHELMACRIMASIELGARHSPSIRLISWPDILASGKLPPDTKNSTAPTSVPVSVELRGQRQSIRVTADTLPFGLERSNPNGSKLYFFFPGVEADCGTEPIEPSDYDRASIYRKFVAYREIAAQGLHKSHFGFPNLFVPIVTTSAARMHSMMAALDRMTAGTGSKMFLFKTFSVNGSDAGPGHMLIEPWERVRFPSLTLTLL